MVTKKGKDIARRPMSIIEARFDLSRRQNDIVDILLTKFDDAPPEQTTFTLKVADIKNLYQMDNKSHAYDFLYKAVKTFEGKGFRLKEDENSETWFSWFSKIKYIKGNSEENSRIELKVDDELRKILEDSRQNAYYRIEYSVNLVSKYSKRIYYYLIDHKNYKAFPNAEKGVFKVDVKEVMEMLQCPKSYKYADFKRYVLQKSYEEINSNTDINFEYKEIEGKTKKGQPSIVAIEFKVTSAPKRKEIIDVADIPEEIKKIKDMFACTREESESIYNTSLKNNLAWEETIEILEYTKNQKTENKVGYALTLLKKGFSKPQKTEPKVTIRANKFSNFESRSYTEEQMIDLEQRALNRNLEDDNIPGQIEINDYPEVLPKKEKVK